ncbi:MAG TPA: dTDP-4-dehydrorhamnose 3,5-epimerase family protein [Ferrovibrio sp.]|uniref:dTDP-4-dehydrorhamnose 3,5-epimerase family protein n=1 Tax=Ferrovibrio sp. TaxID=1917215 RepID=UPI002ED3FCB1
MLLQSEPLAVPGLLHLRPIVFMDQRGWYLTVADEAELGAAGIHDRFVRDSIVYADKTGTVFGLHYQLPPRSQARILRVLRGSIFAAAVDVRRNSSTFGRAGSIELSYMNSSQLYAMAGFALGWCSLEPATEVLIKASAPDDPALARGINWRDPALKIAWPIRAADAIISVEDIDQPMLADQTDLLD